jgi:hypothetical protein
LSSITSLEALSIGLRSDEANRMGIIADRRDHLDLQVNLLTERQATQIIQMLDPQSEAVRVADCDSTNCFRLGLSLFGDRRVDQNP